MAGAGQTNASLMTQCLDFCQALSRQGRGFKFSVSVGSDFTFSLDTKETRPVNKTKKRISPSTKRRNAKRRAEFLSKKSAPEAAVATGLETNQKRDDLFQCDQCDSTFKTQNGLKIHKGKAHKEYSPPEKARNPPLNLPWFAPPLGRLRGSSPATTVAWICRHLTNVQVIQLCMMELM